MAKQTNKLLYFPFDVDFFSDTKIKVLLREYGSDSVMVYIYTLCRIYEKGYYIVADDKFLSMAASDLGLSLGRLRLILSQLCKKSLFDNILFARFTVLSATSVQRRYQEVCKGSKRTAFVDERLWLLEKETTSGLIQVRPNAEKCPKNGDFSEKNQPKKKRKEKENKRAIAPQNVPAEIARGSPPEKQACVRAVTKADLIAEYGEETVTAYEKRFEHWKRKEGSVAVEEYSTIAKWLKADGATKPVQITNSSIDVDEVWSGIIGRYKTEMHNGV